MSGDTPSGGRGSQSWFRGRDDELRARLRHELSRLGGADPFQALSLDYDADPAAVRAAFLQVTKEFHPSRFARRERDIVRQANEVFLRLKAAYDQLRSEEGLARARERHGDDAGRVHGQVGQAEGSGRVQARAATIPASPRARTEGGSRRALTAAGKRRLRELRTARGTEPPVRGNSVVEQVLERNQREQQQFQEGLALGEAKRWDEARRVFHELAVENSHVKRYRVYMHYAWGREHEQGGRVEEARAELRRALDLDPELDEARRALARLPEPKDKPRRLFSRLFRK